MGSFHDFIPEIFFFSLIFDPFINRFLRKFCCTWPIDHALRNSTFKLYLAAQGRMRPMEVPQSLNPISGSSEVKRFASS